MIADQIKRIVPIGNAKYCVHIVDADKRLRKLCEQYMEDKFCEDEPMLSNIKARLDKEMEYVKRWNFESVYLHYHDLIHKNKLRPSQYIVRGTAASSVICFLLGITKENPLDTDLLLYNEFFAGEKGNKEPDIDLEVDPRIYNKVIGSINILAGVQKGVHFRLSLNSPNSKYSDGILIIPEYLDISNEFPIDKQNGELEKVVYSNQYDIDHRFIRYDVHENRNCGFLARLEEKTGYYPSEADINNESMLKRNIFTREDLFEALMKYGVDRQRALSIAENVRKGYGIKSKSFREDIKMLREFSVPEEFIKACLKVEFLPSRADFAELAQMESRIQYYKLHYPEQYYETFY